MQIFDLHHYPKILPTLAKWHFEEWPLLNRDRVALLTNRSSDACLPKTFFAFNGNLLGFACLTNEKGDEFKPWLSSLLVSPEARGQGVGRLLLNYCLQYAGSAGFKAIYLDTIEAPDYYRRLGWDEIGKHEERVIFSKQYKGN